MKIAIFGFSVTEQFPGYIEPCRKKLSGVAEILPFALGGVQHIGTAYFFEHLVRQMGQVDFIGIEIATSHVRQMGYSASEHRVHLEKMISDVRAAGAIPFFINLPRADVDYARDPLQDIIAATCDAHGLPNFNLSEHIQPAQLADLLKDEVHVNEKGAETYADLIAAFIRDQVVTATPPADLPESRSDEIWSALVDGPGLAHEPFNRRGFSFVAPLLEEGQDILIELPRPTNITGLVTVIGPSSGVLEIWPDDGDTSQTLTCYDEFCYYSRLRVYMLDIRGVERLRLRQFPGRPPVQLRKEHEYDGPRIGRPLYVMCRDPGGE